MQCTAKEMKKRKKQMLFIIVTPGTYNNCINGLCDNNIFFVLYVRNLATRKVTTGFRPLFTAKQGIPDEKKSSKAG
jgi:hypothetical protein